MTITRRQRIVDVLLAVLAAVLDLLVWGGDDELRTGGTAPSWVIPAATTAVCATLVLRRRFPLQCLAVQWVYSFIGLLLPGYQPFAGLLVALHAVALRESFRTAVIALLACAVPLAINSYNAASGGRHADPVLNFAITGLLWTTLATLVWGLGRLAYTSARKAEHLHSMQQVAAADAVRLERMRLARELHDIVAHAVSVMILQASGARSLDTGADPRVSKSLEVIETAGIQAMGELHRLLSTLRAAGSATTPADHFDRPPRVSDLADLIDLHRAAGMTIEVAVDGRPGELDPSVGLAAYRVVQESLTNAGKHATPGAVLTIAQHWTPTGLELEIIDRAAENAVPLVAVPADRRRALSSGLGLSGLAERVELVGGQFRAGPDGAGFRVSADLPRADQGAHLSALVPQEVS